MKVGGAIFTSTFSASLMAGGVLYLLSLSGFRDTLDTWFEQIWVPSPYGSWLAAFVIALIFQGLVVTAHYQASLYGFWPFLGPLAVSLSVISGYGSTANTMLILQKANLQERRGIAAGKGTVDQIKRAISMADDAAHKMNLLSEMAREKMEDEADTGGSCTNVIPEKGKGGIHWMRNEHQKTLSAKSGAMADISAKMHDALRTYERSPKGQKSLDAFQDAVTDQLRSSEFKSIRENIATINGHMNGGWKWTDNKGNVNDYQCEDVEYTTVLGPVVVTIENLANIRLTGQYIGTPEVNDAFAAINSDFVVAIRGGEIGIGIFAMIAAGIVEILQACFIYAAVARDRKSGLLAQRHDVVWMPDRSLDENTAKYKARAIRTIFAQMHTLFGKSVFICANPGTEDEIMAVAYLKARSCKKTHSNLDWRYLNGDTWLRVRMTRFSPGSQFDIWEVPNDIALDWARANFAAGTEEKHTRSSRGTRRTPGSSDQVA